MKNRLTDLNDYLFSQIERLADEDLTPEQIETEIKRADAIVKVADQIVDNAKLQLEGTKVLLEWGDKAKGKLPMLGAGSGEERA